MVEYEFNKLILGKKYIQYIFNTNLSKSKLPIWSKDYWNINSSYLKCFKLSQIQRSPSAYFHDDYCYKIVIDYKVWNLVELILPDLELILIPKPSILQISNNNCHNLIKIISKLDYFEHIIFTKKFSTTKYLEIKNMSNVKYVNYKGLWNQNLHNLPSGLDGIKINVKSDTTKLLTIPFGTKRILISIVKRYWKVYDYNLENLENFNEINKILFVFNTGYINISNLEFQYLIYGVNNTFIDFTNIPNCVKILELYEDFNGNMNYLPNSIEKIIINGKNKMDLLNLPSSVKEICYKCRSLDPFGDFGKIPDFIQILNINFNHIGTNDLVLLNICRVPLPNKIKELKIFTSDLVLG